MSLFIVVNNYLFRGRPMEVLVATMGKNYKELYKDMNLQSDAVIVDQCDTQFFLDTKINDFNVKIIKTTETGLSKSRNLALSIAESEICLLADDDVLYIKNYSSIIEKAHKDYPEADIIAFQVERVGNENRKKVFRQEKSWENYITSLQISSVEISFKRKSLQKKGIKFNENIGSGTKYKRGEDNVFIYDSLKNGLKVLYLPIKIGEVDISKSSWFNGFTKEYFFTLGATYYNMSHQWYHILIIQFAIRKYKIYKNNLSFLTAVKQMYLGKKSYKKQYVLK